jgi:hypothetical protein
MPIREGIRAVVCDNRSNFGRCCFGTGCPGKREGSKEHKARGAIQLAGLPVPVCVAAKVIMTTTSGIDFMSYKKVELIGPVQGDTTQGCYTAPGDPRNQVLCFKTTSKTGVVQFVRVSLVYTDTDCHTYLACECEGIWYDRLTALGQPDANEALEALQASRATKATPTKSQTQRSTRGANKASNAQTEGSTRSRRATNADTKAITNANTNAGKRVTKSKLFQNTGAKKITKSLNCPVIRGLVRKLPQSESD